MARGLMAAGARTERLAADAAGIARAAALLRSGRLVAFPTETVYGLGADARDDRSVAAIFEAKGRPRFNPLIIHTPDLAAAAEIAEFDDAARALAAAFWPGPLTLALPRRPDSGISALATVGLETVAVRAPDGAAAQAVLRAAGIPVAAPSANRSGRISPTTAAHALEGLEGRIDAVLDGGPCRVGLESSIVALSPGGARLLRPGGAPREAIDAALTAAGLAPLAHGPAQTDPARPTAPGQLDSHYAPDMALRLGASAPAPGDGWLGFGPDPAAASAAAARRNLSRSGDLVEAAANLFADLRALDQALGGVGATAVAAIPETGLGAAINDRLRRAAAPRPAPGDADL